MLIEDTKIRTFKKDLLFMYVYVCACMNLCALCACRCPQRLEGIRFLEMELQVIVSYCVGTAGN